MSDIKENNKRTREAGLFAFRPGPCMILLLIALALIASAATAQSWRGRNDTGRQRKFETEQETAKRALSYFMRGVYLKGEGEFEKALISFDRALALDPTSYTVRLAVINTAAGLGQFRRARTEALKLQPRDPEAVRMIIDLYREARMSDSVVYYLKELATLDPADTTSRRWLADYYERSGQTDSALIYRRELATADSGFKALNDLGNSEFLAGKIEESLETFEKSLRIESGIANMLGHAGKIDALERLGRHKEQRQALGESYAVNSSHVPTLRRLMNYFARRNLFDSAMIYAQREVELIPQDRGAIRRLGILSYNSDSLEIAEEQFNALIAIGDLDPSNYFFLGQIFLEKKNYKYAEINFKRTISLADTLPDGWVGLAEVYRALDSLDEMEKTYERAAEAVTDPREKVRLLFSLGAQRERSGNFKKSEETFKRVLGIDGNHAPTLNYLGYMLVERNERLTYAKELIARALKISPNNGAYLDSYGWALYQENDFQAALDSLNRALEFIDADPTIFDHVGDVYKELGQADSAQVYWQKAFDIDTTNSLIEQKLKR